MIKVKTETSDIETETVKEARCPVCGCLLMDVRFVKGALIVRVKCPRCKSYVNVDIVGVNSAE